jgi:hypothetical protein
LFCWGSLSFGVEVGNGFSPIGLERRAIMDDVKLDKLYKQAEVVQEKLSLKDKERNGTPHLWKLLFVCFNGIVKRPKGVFRKRCPECGCMLKRVAPFDPWTYLVCPRCDYEWCSEDVDYYWDCS